MTKKAIAKTAPTPSSLTDQQLIVLDGMLAGKKQVDLAQALEIAPETISRWKQDPVFQAEHNRRRREVNDQVSERLRRLQLDALDVLDEMLGSEERKDRYQAAISVLKMAGPQVVVPGTEDPEEIRMDQAQQEQMNLLARAIMPW